MLLECSRSQLVVIDVQTKLVSSMNDFPPVERNCQRLLGAARRLDVPVTLTEQYPSGLGETIESLLAGSAPEEVLPKVSFSCAGDPEILRRLRMLERNQIILAGIENHVCVLQTALSLKFLGFAVFVALDAVTSRLRSNVEIAATRLHANGIELVSTEMVIFEWLERAGTPLFRSIRDLIV